MTLGGLTGHNREWLAELNRKAKGPFTLTFIAETLGVSKAKAKSLAIFWVTQGWLTRIKRGLYTKVSLGTMQPGAQREDPLLVANAVFAPCYIGGWTACEHWDFTEQIFSDVVVFTTRRYNSRERRIQGINYIVNTISPKRFYGLKTVWQGAIKIAISDPSRTIIDIIDNPSIGGGIRNVTDMVNEYFEGDERNDKTLIGYLSSFGNRVIYKRLGYLIEYLNINAPEILKICYELRSSGYSMLDPILPLKGKTIRRWNLRLNASLEGALK